MNGEEFARIATKIYGRKKWKVKLAEDLGVDRITIYRMTKREQIPGPYEVALRGLLEHRKREIALEKEARKLLPRGYKIRNVAPRKPRPKPARRRRKPRQERKPDAIADAPETV
jgi:hypothetical protein